MNVLLIFGGASPEHEVSIRSANTIYKALKSKHEVFCAYITKEDVWQFVESPDKLEDAISLNYEPVSRVWSYGETNFNIDIAFPIVHGVGGEDGVLQNKLALWGVKFVGTPAEESELCFDKRATKEVLRANNINVVEEIILMSPDDAPNFAQATQQLNGDVLFVKPSRSGSSVGVHKVKDQDSFTKAIEDAFKYDSVVLVERAVTKPRELEMAVLESPSNVYKASAPGEIIADGEFYSYDSKYSSNSQSQTLVNPPGLPTEIGEEMKSVSLKANEVLGCRGLVRVDFLYDGDRKILYLNEVNTLPGFTSISMYPILWEGTGIEIDELVDIMVQTAYGSE